MAKQKSLAELSDEDILRLKFQHKMGIPLEYKHANGYWILDETPLLTLTWSDDSDANEWYIRVR